VILSVCPYDKTKTAETKIVKLRTEISITILRPQIILGQGHRVTKCKSIPASCYDIGTAMLFQHGCSFTLPPIVMGDRMAGVSNAMHLYRVPLSFIIVIILRQRFFLLSNLNRNTGLHSKLLQIKIDTASYYRHLYL